MVLMLVRRLARNPQAALRVIEQLRKQWDRLTPDTRQRLADLATRVRQARGPAAQSAAAVAMAEKLVAQAGPDESSDTEAFLHRARRLETAREVAGKMSQPQRGRNLLRLRRQRNALFLDMTAWLVDRDPAGNLSLDSLDDPAADD